MVREGQLWDVSAGVNSDNDISYRLLGLLGLSFKGLL